MHMTRAARLRQILKQGGPGIVPGATDCLTAKLIEQAGYPCVYVTGGGASNTFLGAPDLGIMTLNELASQAERISDAVSIPVISDVDTGFGGVANVKRAIKMYERAGIAGFHIEDQEFPKRCGHFEGKVVVSTESMLYRIQAAVDARTDPDFLIIARTDARAVEGVDAAIERCHRYREAGADAIFFEQAQNREELQRVGIEFKGVPLVANMIERSKTPILPASDLLSMGFNIILYANLALYLGTFAIKNGLKQLREEGHSLNMMERMLSFQERQELVGLAKTDAAEKDLVDRGKKRLAASER